MTDITNLKLQTDTSRVDGIISQSKNGAFIMRRAFFDIVATILIIALFLVENGQLLVKEQSIISFVGSIAVVFMLSMLFDNNYRIKGRIHGMANEEYIKEKNRLDQLTSSLDDSKIKLIMENLAVTNDNNLLSAKSSLLYGVGINLEEYNSKYKFQDSKKLKEMGLTNMQIKNIKRANKVKIKPLCINNLMSYKLSQTNGGELKTQKQMDVEHNIKGVITYLLTAVLFGYFAVDLAQNMTMQNIGWFLIKVAFLLFRGVKSYFESYMEITDQVTQGIKQRIMILSRLAVVE